MSVARAEARLAAVLLVELLMAVAEEDDREDAERATPAPVDAVPEPIAPAA